MFNNSNWSKRPTPAQDIESKVQSLMKSKGLSRAQAIRSVQAQMKQSMVIKNASMNGFDDNNEEMGSLKDMIAKVKAKARAKAKGKHKAKTLLALRKSKTGLFKNIGFGDSDDEMGTVFRESPFRRPTAIRPTQPTKASREAAIKMINDRKNKSKMNRKVAMIGFGEFDDGMEGFSFKKAFKSVKKIAKKVTAPIKKLVPKPKAVLKLITKPSLKGIVNTVTAAPKAALQLTAPLTSAVLKPVAPILSPVLNMATGISSMVPIIGAPIASLTNEALSSAGVLSVPKAPTAVFESATPVMVSQSEDAITPATQVYSTTPTSEFKAASESAPIVFSSSNYDSGNGGGGGGGSSWGGSSKRSSRQEESEDENEESEVVVAPAAPAPVEAPKKSAAPVVLGLAALAGLYFTMKE